jgi:hypothetical protein
MGSGGGWFGDGTAAVNHSRKCSFGERIDHAGLGLGRWRANGCGSGCAARGIRTRKRCATTHGHPAGFYRGESNATNFSAGRDYDDCARKRAINGSQTNH